MTVRPEVVELLTDVRVDPDAPLSRWTRFDGRPLTRDEIRLIEFFTVEEWRAAVDYQRRAAEYHEERQADFRRVQELIEPYDDRVPDDALFDDIVAQMPKDEQDELNIIMERLAPDGMLYIPGD